MSRPRLAVLSAAATVLLAVVALPATAASDSRHAAGDRNLWSSLWSQVEAITRALVPPPADETSNPHAEGTSPAEDETDSGPKIDPNG